MAITLDKKTRINISATVNSAIDSIRKVRAADSARKEADFQKLIAEGTMSFKAQLTFREKQLKEEKAFGFFDPSFIQYLEVSVGNTKKLIRFERIRNKYQESFDDYIASRGSISNHIKILQDSLNSEVDPTFRKELQTLLSEAQATQATIEFNAVQNKALRVQKDNSVALIDESIAEVSDRKAMSKLAGNDDEVEMWEETLTSLKGARAKILIENSINDMIFDINKGGLDAGAKLNLLGSEIEGADSTTPIIYNGVSYDSQRAFWENERNKYINTAFFQELREDLDAETSRIAAGSKFGQIPVIRMQEIDDFYNMLKGKDEFLFYGDILERERVRLLNEMVTDLAESIFNEEMLTEDRVRAEQSILNLEAKFGIKISREPFASELEGGETIAGLVPDAPEEAPTPEDTEREFVRPDGFAEVFVDGEHFRGTAEEFKNQFGFSPDDERVGIISVDEANQRGFVFSTSIPATTQPTEDTTPEPAPQPDTTPEVTPDTTPEPTPTSSASAGGSYTVVSGDTLGAIASANKTTVQALVDLNEIENPDLINVGQIIKLK